MGWRDEYLTSIDEAEANHPVNADLIDTCTKLADKVAALEAENEALSNPAPAPPPATPKPKVGYFSSSTSAPDPVPPPTDPQLRRDLAEALRSKAQAETRLRKADAELERLTTQADNNARTIQRLSSEKNTLTRKLRDRDEELRGKTKLMEDVQDELLALNMELNIVREKERKTSAENKELVARWLRHKTQEVDMMNERNEPKLSRQR